jgi:ankyrin repeat protein
MSDKNRCLSNIMNKKLYIKVKRLFDINANANYININGRLLLLYAAEYRKSKIAVFLFEYGADVDTADDDEYKRILLYWVARSDCSPIIKKLLKKGLRLIV